MTLIVYVFSSSISSICSWTSSNRFLNSDIFSSLIFNFRLKNNNINLTHKVDIKLSNLSALSTSVGIHYKGYLVFITFPLFYGFIEICVIIFGVLSIYHVNVIVSAGRLLMLWRLGRMTIVFCRAFFGAPLISILLIAFFCLLLISMI